MKSNFCFHHIRELSFVCLIVFLSWQKSTDFHSNLLHIKWNHWWQLILASLSLTFAGIILKSHPWIYFLAPTCFLDFVDKIQRAFNGRERGIGYSVLTTSLTGKELSSSWAEIIQLLILSLAISLPCFFLDQTHKCGIAVITGDKLEDEVTGP